MSTLGLSIGYLLLSVAAAVTPARVSFFEYGDT